jgi:glutaconyl-CoA/methylmalonyl-CoA decarboxylase subunit gamma
MKFTFNNQGKNYEVEITGWEDRAKITVNGKDFLFGGFDEAPVAPVPQTMIPKRDLSNKEVRAVLAGTISELSVGAGDIVKTGQKLLTLSAMKMENEILAETDGKIKEIKVAKDQKVKEGDVLIIMA